MEWTTLGIVGLGVVASVGCGPQVLLDDGGGIEGGGTTDASNSGGSGDGNDVSDGLDDTATSGPMTTSPPSTSTTSPPDDTGIPPDPIACLADDECDTGYCLMYSDAPPDPGAYCAEPQPDGGTRLTGTVRAVDSLTPQSGLDVMIVPALQAATNPTGADPVALGVSGADGRVDAATNGPANAQIGLMAIVTGPGLTRTITAAATPVEGPAYGPGNDVHDLWAVPAMLTEAWTNALVDDPDIEPDLLPIGAAGGALIVVRDHATGTPIAGATVASIDGNSPALIRYPTLDGFGLQPFTSDNGIAIVLRPALAENFAVELDGQLVGQAVILSSNDSVWVFGVTVD